MQVLKLCDHNSNLKNWCLQLQATAVNSKVSTLVFKTNTWKCKFFSNHLNAKQFLSITVVSQLHKVQLTGIRDMQHDAAAGYQILLEGNIARKYEH